VDQLLTRLGLERIHRAQEIQINAFDRELVAFLVDRLTRRMTFDLVITERQLYVSLGDASINGGVARHGIGLG
jgi:hypothetical protein